MKTMTRLMSVLLLAFCMIVIGCNPSTGNTIASVANDDYYATAEIGDYILKDGIICKQADLTTENKPNVVAVIFRKATLLTPALGVAVDNVSGDVWANKSSNTASEAQGYNNCISELLWNDTTKTGLKDGSKSLDIIKKICPDYFSFPEKYGVWKKTESYGGTKGYKTLAEGWYIPTVSEITEIVDNLETLNNAINLIKTDSTVSEIKNIYWTCNQQSLNRNAYRYNVTTKTLEEFAKTNEYRVRPIRAFSSKNVDYNKAKVGDIVFENGLFANADDYCSNAKVAAIIFRAADGTNPAMGVGLVKGSNLSWCTNTAQGYAKIDSLTDANTKRSAEAYSKLCTAAPDVIANPDNYPAWKYCATYGATNNLSKMLLGWTLPSVQEINDLYTNQTAVNNAVTQINTVSGTSLTEYTEYFWSCNQSSNAEQARVKEKNSNQAANKNGETYGGKVIAVREFTSNEVVKQTVSTPVVKGIKTNGGEINPALNGQAYEISWDSSAAGKVKITCDPSDAVIYYYIEQKLSEGLHRYAGPFELNDWSDTIFIFAVKDGYNPSEIKKCSFTVPIY